MKALTQDIHACRLCRERFAHEPRPVIQVSASCRLAIIGQAPSRTVQETGVPWDDPSGKRLREWLQLSDQEFYDEKLLALLPMAFCYPGQGKSGDLPPPPICAKTWHPQLLRELPKLQLTLLLGQYAQRRYLPNFKNVTESAKRWREGGKFLALPHPSPRNQHWFKKNPWFTEELLPYLRERVARAIKKPAL